jgi:hypothetical protein
MCALLILLPLLLAPRQGSDSMNAFLPDAIASWTRSEPPRQYSGREIFEYMDGAGEVYLAYRFQALLVQRYAAQGLEEILVEIFDMGTSQNAFGISTYMRGRGPAAPVGEDGEYKSGLLTFWKGRYYVCIRVAKEHPGAHDGVLAGGRLIAGAIHEEGARPTLIRSLPPGAYREESLRYFYRDEILETHITLPEGNPLRLTGTTEGVLARAKRDRSDLLVIRYADSREAASAHGSALIELLPGNARNGIAKTKEGTWNACRQKGIYLWLVLGAPTEERARELLTSIGRRLR